MRDPLFGPSRRVTSPLRGGRDRRQPVREGGCGAWDERTPSRESAFGSDPVPPRKGEATRAFSSRGRIGPRLSKSLFGPPRLRRERSA